MENKLITAEEVLSNNIDGLREIINDDDTFNFYKGVIINFGIEFAKLVGKEILNKASESAKTERKVFQYSDVYNHQTVVDRQSILNSFDLNEIR